MLHLALVLCALVVIAPIVWTVGAGFRTQISLLMGHMTFTPIWNNFNEVLWSKTSDFLLNYRNSIIVGVLSTLLCVVVATLAAFSLNRLKWPGWVVHIFLAWTMIFHMIPPVARRGAGKHLHRPDPRPCHAQPADRHLADGGVHPRGAEGA
jgi:multiple sugar transport system permease protein